MFLTIQSSGPGSVDAYFPKSPVDGHLMGIWNNVSKGELPDLFASKPDFCAVFALKSMFEGVLVSGWVGLFLLSVDSCLRKQAERQAKSLNANIYILEFKVL